MNTNLTNTKAAHKWTKGEAITADRLNTTSAAANAALAALKAQVTPQADNVKNGVSQWGIAYEEPRFYPYDESTKAYFRHATLGTGDLFAGESAGIYLTAPTIQRGTGEVWLDYVGGGQRIASYYVEGATAGDIVYLHYETTKTGKHTGTPYYTLERGSVYIFGLNSGGGKFAEPVAKIIRNPSYEKELIAMEYDGPKVPIIADDASIIPDTMPRYTQGVRIAEPLQDSIVPIRGLNNKGGLHILEPDVDGAGRISNALKVEVEMYGLVGANTGENTGYPTGIQNVRTLQPYNATQPFKTSGDGTLATWPVKLDGQEVGQISLEGQHLDSWQLGFKGEGAINIPTASIYATIESLFADGYTMFAEHSIALDFMYNFSATSTGLFVQELTRYSEFGLNEQGAVSLNRGEFGESQTYFFEFCQTLYAEVITLQTPDNTEYTTGWEGFTLKLVQQPIYGASRYVEGHSLLDSPYYEPVITGYRLI